MDEAAIQIRQLVMGFRSTQLLCVAAKLGVADELESGPRTAADLADASGTNSEALYRVLRALTTLGVLLEEPEGVFALTDAGQLLRTNASGSLRDVAILYGEDWVWRAYAQMMHSVRTGKPGFDQAHGQSFYDFLTHTPDAGRVFQKAMGAFSKSETSAILRACDFAGTRTIVDIGAGHGALLAALLTAHPHLRGVAFDSPAQVEGARALFAERGLSDRASAVGGDFFQEVPSSGDLYILKSVLHNWVDADAARILKVCRRAMERGTRLIAMERVIPSATEPAEAKLFDINMLVTLGGCERTESEFRVLLERTGFEFRGTAETESALSLVEAVAV